MPTVQFVVYRIYYSTLYKEVCMWSVNYYKRCVHLYFVLAACFLISGCSVTGKALKRGDEAAKRGDYYTAVQEYLGVLSTKPKHSKSLRKLSEVGEKAYIQKLDRAKAYEKQDNLEEALAIYKQLSTYIGQLKRFNALNFTPINIQQAIISVSSGAAEKHYKQAESLFKQNEYMSAISAYQAALELTSPYKDASEKIAESHYLYAENAEKSKQFREAADHFKAAHESQRGFKDAAKRAGKIYYHLGEYFLSRKNCRNAYEDFNRANNIDPLVENLANKRKEAFACAAVKIAFVEFDNPTGKNLAGMALGDFIFETIKTKVQANASQFVKMLDREQLDVLAREQQIAAGSFESAANASKLEGVHYLIFGKINQMQEMHPGLSKRSVQAIYRYPHEITKTDKKGKAYRTYEMRDANMVYNVYSDSRSVKLAGAIRVVNAKTGAVVINFQIGESASDAVEYAGEYQARHDLNSQNIELDSDFVRLSKARKSLQDVDSLARSMIENIANKMSNQILQKLDQTPKLSDPRSLSLSGT